jgi:hypothetical protein
MNDQMSTKFDRNEQKTVQESARLSSDPDFAGQGGGAGRLESGVSKAAPAQT